MPGTGRGRLASYLVAMGLVGVYGGCAEKPSMPSWEVVLRLPVLNETRTMTDIASDNEFLTVDDQGVLKLSIVAELDRIELGDHLALDPEPQTFDAEVGDVVLEDPVPVQTPDILLTDLLPRGEAPAREDSVLRRDVLSKNVSAPAQTAESIPPFAFEIFRDLPNVDSFRAVTLTSGLARVAVRNDLAVPLVDPEDEPGELIVMLNDDRSGGRVGEVRFRERIAPGEIADAILDLGGRSLSEDLSVLIRGQSSGSEGRPAEPGAWSSSFDVEVSFLDLVASDADARLPSQRFGGEDAIVLPEAVRPREASIASGEIAVRAVNAMPVDADVTIRFEEYLDEHGHPLRAETIVPSWG